MHFFCSHLHLPGAYLHVPISQGSHWDSACRARTQLASTETGRTLFLAIHFNRWNRKTGQWTYDGIAIYNPPAPATNTFVYSYGYYGPHQQRQQQQQQRFYSYAQPSVRYYVPGPYVASQNPYAAAHQQPWQSPPPMQATTVPCIIPAAPLGVASVFF